MPRFLFGVYIDAPTASIAQEARNKVIEAVEGYLSSGCIPEDAGIDYDTDLEELDEEED